jgi:protein-S-isoprenylcysteine O-methyltransferase Ste14
MKISELAGSGRQIMILTLPILLIGLILNLSYPAFFSAGGPSPVLRVISILFLIAGVMNWVWSVYLVLTKAAKNELITNGPFAIVKHPIYSGVAFLVLPAAGILLDSWLGIIIGIVVYTGSRIYSPLEEKKLSELFGARWDEYIRSVKIPWL